MSDQPNVRIRLGENKRLESSVEGRQKRCRRNLQWQAVPDLNTPTINSDHANINGIFITNYTNN